MCFKWCFFSYSAAVCHSFAWPFVRRFCPRPPFHPIFPYSEWHSFSAEPSIHSHAIFSQLSCFSPFQHGQTETISFHPFHLFTFHFICTSSYAQTYIRSLIALALPSCHCMPLKYLLSTGHSWLLNTFPQPGFWTYVNVGRTLFLLFITLASEARILLPSHSISVCCHRR